MLLELLNIYIESRTTSSYFPNYLVACYNARQGWVPQQHYFHTLDYKNHQLIEFDNKNKKFFWDKFGYSIVFEFTDLSILTLMDMISLLPKIENKNRRKTIKLGYCLRHVSINRIIELSKIAYKRVNLEFTDS